ncbi:efflux RND transporter periplasmic adaptor subunit [Chitinophaga sp. G-6-1-13]|uniref:Efflux RND transporter periplasmic adaptor subunit n=1 Tax=Chitinophaga fulva TaxID=2728842 RepID=A0A848GN99_9BACT|nr:efflux RND transporter periplasmic adaptor subunit [Chitinophaga fulva]NML40095.1 efflux RND transporter periplasmic adaptor subunit [Chitinophaga fulva]
MKTTAFTLPWVVVLLSACSSGEQTAALTTIPSLKVVRVGSGATTIRNEYPATVEGGADVEIRPQVNGVLEKIYVDEGAFVAAGQLLFKIQDFTYREQLNMASAGLLAARAALANTQLEIEKITPLVQNKVVSDQQLKTAIANHELALARVKEAEAQVADARINLGHTLISAPFSGYIGRLNKKAGSLLTVTDAGELTTLSDIRQVHVYFSLSEREFVALKQHLPGSSIEEKLRKAPPVYLTLAGGEEYASSGQLDMVNSAFNKTTGAITVRASFPNNERLLRSGNTGKIRLQFTDQQALTIPQAATLEVQDKTFVFAVDDSGRVHKRAITISGTAGNQYLISQGLDKGHRIVLENLETLQEGTHIQPIVQIQ